MQLSGARQRPCRSLPLVPGLHQREAFALTPAGAPDPLQPALYRARRRAEQIDFRRTSNVPYRSHKGALLRLTLPLTGDLDPLNEWPSVGCLRLHHMSGEQTQASVGKVETLQRESLQIHFALAVDMLLRQSLADGR
jgi:hypothetical protein